MDGLHQLSRAATAVLAVIVFARRQHETQLVAPEVRPDPPDHDTPLQKTVKTH